jgi:hypothetical protein
MQAYEKRRLVRLGALLLLCALVLFEVIYGRREVPLCLFLLRSLFIHGLIGCSLLTSVALSGHEEAEEKYIFWLQVVNLLAATCNLLYVLFLIPVALFFSTTVEWTVLVALLFVFETLLAKDDQEEASPQSGQLGCRLPLMPLVVSNTNVLEVNVC